LINGNEAGNPARGRLSGGSTRNLICLVALAAASCGRAPGRFPVPEQRSLDLGVDPGVLAPFIKMQDPAANDYIVRDIGRDPGIYRWAFLHPEMRFRIGDSAEVHFSMDFALPEQTFRTTGPVTVSYAIDRQALGSIRCDHAGKYQVLKPVPAGWLRPNQEVRVSFDADHRWISPEDGAQLSFLLFSAGFVP